MNVNVFSTFIDLQASDSAEAKNLMHVQADAILVQETHLSAKACDEEASRMMGLGWNASFSPATDCIPGRRGTGSGGLLTACSQQYGLGCVEGLESESVIVPGRAAMALHSGFSVAGVLLVNVYLFDKVGMTADNLEILSKLLST